jgi:hypothetical protein
MVIRARTFPRMRPLLVWGAAVGALAAMFFGLQAAVRDSGEWVARMMSPPIYPGSVLVNHTRTHLPGYMLEVTEYETIDEYGRVVDYISDHYIRLRGRSQRHTTTRTGFSLLNAADFIGLGPTIRPRTSVGVFGSANLAVTKIRIMLIWPVAGETGVFEGEAAP